VQPLFFRDGGRPTPRGADWFSATKDAKAGISQTLTFGDALREQTIESMT